MDNKDWIGVDTFYFSKWLTVPAYALQTLRGYCFKYRNPGGKGEFPLHSSTVRILWTTRVRVLTPGWTDSDVTSHKRPQWWSTLSLQPFNSVTSQVFGLISPFESQHQSPSRLEAYPRVLLTLLKDICSTLGLIPIGADWAQTLPSSGDPRAHTGGPWPHFRPSILEGGLGVGVGDGGRRLATSMHLSVVT